MRLNEQNKLIEEVHHLKQLKHTNTDIATILSISLSSVKRYLKKTPTEFEIRPTKVKDISKLKEIKDLREDGRSIETIADKFDISKSQVYKYLSEADRCDMNEIEEEIASDSKTDDQLISHLKEQIKLLKSIEVSLKKSLYELEKSLTD